MSYAPLMKKESAAAPAPRPAAARRRAVPTGAASMRVGAANDPLEREADRLADSVLRGHTDAVRRAPAEEDGTGEMLETYTSLGSMVPVFSALDEPEE